MTAATTRLDQPTPTSVPARAGRLPVSRSPYPRSRNVAAATAASTGVSTPRTASTPAPGRSWSPGPESGDTPASRRPPRACRRRSAYRRYSASAAAVVRATAARPRTRSRPPGNPERSSRRRISGEAITSSSALA
ncbi:hypothetical protein [Streptomyces griseus]|uniref:hypothetical protein n=1 Tax=Streptomyces griseus TaxID=1911 RepID=UPI00374E0F27